MLKPAMVRLRRRKIIASVDPIDGINQTRIRKVRRNKANEAVENFLTVAIILIPLFMDQTRLNWQVQTINISCHNRFCFITIAFLYLLRAQALKLLQIFI
jgi:hypothetical protein